MNYFSVEDTLHTIIENYPETLPVFTSNGFSRMQNPEERKRFGATIDLKTAMMLKNLDVSHFSKLLTEAIDNHRRPADLTLAQSEKREDGETIELAGLLPCPVRLPLLEGFTEFSKEFTEKTGIHINHELKAASMGLDWVQEHIEGVEDASKLPDLFISAGFDMFFDRDKIGRFMDAGVFKDFSGLETYNTNFPQLKDPKGQFSMIGVVPAVFLINTEELGDLPLPTSWEDVLKPEFEKRVSLPVGDFDLFNGILLNIHKKYGDEGVRKLGRSLLESMHPSQMVKSGQRRTNVPAVTIMPYFFTKMVKPGSTLQAVWPSDGAIISPIFMLSKQEKRESLKPLVEFFASQKVGEILSHNGLFPSVNPQVDNRIPEENSYMWLGWDYLYEHDITQLIAHCEQVFNSALEEAV